MKENYHWRMTSAAIVPPTLVCKKDKPDTTLIPQIVPGKIHYCPRRFYEDCVEVKDEWRHDQNQLALWVAAEDISMLLSVALSVYGEDGQMKENYHWRMTSAASVPPRLDAPGTQERIRV
jgi:hypothetical protein